MRCLQCEAFLSADSKVCSKCGAVISPPTAESAHLTRSPLAISIVDPARLTRWLNSLLYLLILIDIVSIFSSALQYRLLSSLKLGTYESLTAATAAAESNDLRELIVGGSQTLAIIATIILFCVWVYRANSNAHRLGAKDMRFSPGWAVGYYFIPVLYLWKPYQSMKEIWQSSKNPNSWTKLKSSPILPWWWFFFLLSNVLGQISLRLSLNHNSVDQLLNSTAMGIGADLTNIPAAIFLRMLIRQINQMQVFQSKFPSKK